jgi:hypothetical protein
MKLTSKVAPLDDADEMTCHPATGVHRLSIVRVRHLTAAAAD